MMLGALMMVLADILSRTLNAPTETHGRPDLCGDRCSGFHLDQPKGAKKPMRKKQKQIWIPLLMAVLLVLGILFDLNAGYAQIPLSELFAGNPVLLDIRLPRVLACVLVGAGLSTFRSSFAGGYPQRYG